MTLLEAAAQADQIAQLAEWVDGGNDIPPGLFRVFAHACRELANARLGAYHMKCINNDSSLIDLTDSALKELP